MLKNVASVKFLHLAKFYKVEFPNSDSVADALRLLKDLDEWTDPRYKNQVHVYAQFERPMEQVVAGRFRSHFYGAIKTALENMEAMTDKTVEMKIVSQTLVVDLDGEPYELIHLPLQPDKSIRVLPNYDIFEEVGFSKEDAEKLIEKASAAAHAGR